MRSAPRPIRGGPARLAAATLLGAAAAMLLRLAAGAPARQPPEAGETAAPAAGIEAWRLAPTPLPPPEEIPPREVARVFGEATPLRQAVMLRGLALAASPRRRELLQALPPTSDARLRGLQEAIVASIAAGPSPEAFPEAAAIDPEAWRLVASDPREPAFERRVAAALLRGHPAAASPHLAESLGSMPLADSDGGVAAAVLAAESLLEADAAIDASRLWIGSFEDDRKRAGLLLLALAAGPADAGAAADAASLLDARLWSAASPPLRRIHAATEFAVGRWSPRAPPRELFARLRQGEDGRIDLDLLLGRLAGGDAEAVELLLDLPSPPQQGEAAAVSRWERELAIRGLLRRRFLPELHAAIGDPAAADRAAVASHRDRALASWWLSRRDLRFDAALRQWRRMAPTQAASADAAR